MRRIQYAPAHLAGVVVLEMEEVMEDKNGRLEALVCLSRDLIAVDIDLFLNGEEILRLDPGGGQDIIHYVRLSRKRVMRAVAPKNAPTWGRTKGVPLMWETIMGFFSLAGRYPRCKTLSCCEGMTRLEGIVQWHI